MSRADTWALSVVGVLEEAISRMDEHDPCTAHRLRQELLALLLGPGGRALAPWTSTVISRLLAGAASA